jgi:basic membrane protein A
MKRFLAFLLAAAFAALCAGSALAAPIPAKDVKAGFVYIGPIGDGGWTYMQNQGRLEMEKAYPGLTSSYVESVPEGPDSERVMETFIRNGSKVIFATSFGYMDFVQNVAKKHPDVIFMHCSGYKRGPNVGTYFGRMYQPRYLSGLVAGKMTKSNVIGYVAAFPIPEVIRGIDAFSLGVLKANPKAKVKVVWLFSWHDPAKEKEAVKALADAKADVVAMHADTGAAPQAAEELGIWVVGYNNDMSKYAPTRHLTAPIWDWGVIYKHVAEQVTKGTWKSEDIWWGMDKGVVALSPFGKAVPADVRALVETEKKKILSGKWDVFYGPIKDQKGKVRVPAGSNMSDKDKLSLTWFVENVEGDLPK